MQLTAAIPAATVGRVAGLWLLVGAVAGGLVIGVLWQPLLAAGMVACLVSLAVAALPGILPSHSVLGLLGVVLAGYAFLGRGFAYLGVPPIYIGEIVLALTLIVSLASHSMRAGFDSPVIVFLAAFAAWGAVRTIPYFPAYHVDALRDAAVWGYGAFALILAGAITRSRGTELVVRWYGRMLPVFLLWLVAIRVASVFGSGFEFPPGPSGVPLIGIKPGDVAVHLAGVAAFLVLNLRRRCNDRLAWFQDWLLWALWLACFLIYGSQNRGGLVALVTSLLVLLLLAKSGRWANIGALSLAVLLLFLAMDIEVDIGSPRKASPQQILANLVSVTGSEEGSFENSRRWRLMWWQKIIRYTMQGPYFWHGKGFGVNLADDDQFQVTPDRSLRSPHNGHLNILARTGVPGVLLWAALQLAFAMALLRRYRRLVHTGDSRRSAFILWIFCYWIAALTNAAFDVYLEGPQGGVWFWCLVGAGIAATTQSRDGGSQPDPLIR